MHDQASAGLQVSEQQLADLLTSILTATRLDLNFVIQRHPGETPEIAVAFTGPDTACLTVRDAELLKAIEHIAAKVSRLNPDQHDFLSFDADHYKRKRDQAFLQSARHAADTIRETNLPFIFPPMSSHERRQLHLILNAMGLHTASTGEGATRRLVLYPPGTPTP